MTAPYQLRIYYFSFVAFPTFTFKIISPHTSMTGKIVAERSPVFRLPPATSETLPTIVGPAAAPKSPAKAKKANIAVPPLGHFCEDILIEPGHMIPTAKPQSAQPASPRMGRGDSEASK